VTVLVRPTEPDAPQDIVSIAEIRIRSWQAAYRGIVPQEFLDALRLADEVARRLRSPGPPTSQRNYLAERDGSPVGWAAIGPYRDGDDVPSPGPRAGEVYAMYVHPDAWGEGVGRALMERMLAELADGGHDPLMLWVLTDNARARGFYARMGFEPDGAEHWFDVRGVRLPEVRYRYAGA
jgi:GNAT superfamily N-acetyltransferase